MSVLFIVCIRGIVAVVPLFSVKTSFSDENEGWKNKNQEKRNKEIFIQRNILGNFYVKAIE